MSENALDQTLSAATWAASCIAAGQHVVAIQRGHRGNDVATFLGFQCSSTGTCRGCTGNGALAGVSCTFLRSVCSGIALQGWFPRCLAAFASQVTEWALKLIACGFAQHCSRVLIRVAELSVQYSNLKLPSPWASVLTGSVVRLLGCLLRLHQPGNDSPCP